jgi:hypothetical protein
MGMKRSGNEDDRSQGSESMPIGVRLEQSLNSGRCPICALLRPEELDMLITWLGKVAVEHDREAFNTLTGRGGFCNFHSWQFSQIGGPQGKAPFAMALMMARLADLKNQGAVNFSSNDCPVCEALLTNETAYLQHLAHWLRESNHQLRYAKSRGLCLPHLARINSLIQDTALMKLLDAALITQLELLVQKLAEFIRKKDPPLRWGQSDDEKRAPTRSIEKLVGWFGMPDNTP